MKEDLLHYVWRMKSFDFHNLRTTTGKEITILQWGEHNSNAGPDFLNAKIKIGDTLWAGNVEMHLTSSDWIRHRHSEDPSYDNVILHVVLIENVLIRRVSGEIIPCLELQQRIPKELYSNYLKLIHQERKIPCGKECSSVPAIIKNMWLERLMVERLEEKIIPIKKEMDQTQNNREEVFYRFLARHFGTNINGEPFERLARSIPYSILIKHSDNLFSLEALLFGQAGMLLDVKDDYSQQLKKEYEFLKHKYSLQRLVQVSEWKLLRLRPANFPYLRIAQFASLVFCTPRLFDRILEIKHYPDIMNWLHVGVSDYWNEHYVLGKKSIYKKKHLGKSMIHSIAINAIAPFIFHYGWDRDDTFYKEKALQLLEDMPPEKNHVITIWKDLGIEPKNALQSQALLQLKKKYCSRKKCLNCSIGHHLVGKK